MKSIPAVPRKPVVLVILDGFGVNPAKANNAVALAHTPNLDHYFANYTHTTLSASGLAVGLPDGQMGNSEVGHLTLGSGQVIRQDIMRINDSIENGEFFRNPVLLDAIAKAKKSNRPLHLLGLVSDGGVHSHLDHLLAMIRLCQQHGVSPLLHMITDGRDTAPKSALTYLAQVEPLLHQCGGAVASVMGRYFAMDRDHRWDRTELAWRALTLGKGQKGISAQTAISSAYAAGDSDEFIRPIILPSFTPIQTDDQVICFNYRKDRPRQIVDALANADFSGFDRGDQGQAQVSCFMQYNNSWQLPYAFAAQRPATTVAKVLSEAGVKQLHCSETEKFAHVTYFLDGGEQNACPGETQLLIPSPSVATYDQKPEMSAVAVADAVVNALRSQQFGFIVVNFANGDMVGHTANAKAIIQAVEALDKEVGRVLDVAMEMDYSVIVTADHGNCEEMVDPVSGEPQTKHTPYPVPCIVIDDHAWQLSTTGGLANVAPTVLQLMGVAQPQQMPAKSLLLKSQGTMSRQSGLRGAA